MHVGKRSQQDLYQYAHSTGYAKWYYNPNKTIWDYGPLSFNTSSGEKIADITNAYRWNTAAPPQLWAY